MSACGAEGAGLSARFVESLAGIDAIHAEWDALAVAAGRPFSAPAWPLAWWRNLAPTGARLRVIAIERAGAGLVGVVPLYAVRGAYATLGATMAPVEPATRAGLEAEVVAAAAELLASERPRAATIELRRHESAPDWVAMLSDAWPGHGAAIWAEAEATAPRIELGTGFEDWFSGKSKSFRRDIRRSGRRIEQAGGSFRLATMATLERDVAEFLRLHRLRLSERGGSNLPAANVDRMLMDVGAALLPSGRFRLLCLDVDGRVAAANLLLAAGPEVSAWNSGFDDDYRDLSPIMQCLLRALDEAGERGERTMSLGPGDQPYKYRLTDVEDRVVSCVVIPRGVSYPLAQAGLLGRRLRRAVSLRLSPQSKRRLRGLVRRR